MVIKKGVIYITNEKYLIYKAWKYIFILEIRGG